MSFNISIYEHWWAWTLLGWVSQAEEWVGSHKLTTHKLHLQLRLRQSWRDVCDEAQSELDDCLQPDQNLQTRRCMVCRLGLIEPHDIPWGLIPRSTKAQTTRLCGNWGWHNSPHSKCRQCPIWGRRQSNLHQERFACTYNNKERGLSWPDCRTRHASSLQWWRMQCKIYQFGLPLYTIVTPNTMGIKIPLGYMICSFGRGLYYQQKSLETWLEVIFARMTRVRPNAIVIDKS